MGQVTTETPTHIVSPFNGPVEIGLRALCVLTTAFPAAYALQRLVVFDYFLVHSDDIEGGPEGLHPRTPHRGGEILVRRVVIHVRLHVRAVVLPAILRGIHDRRSEDRTVHRLHVLMCRARCAHVRSR